MATRYPRRRLDDCTPDLGELDDWLATQAAEGWQPEYGGHGVAVLVNDRTVRRFAMIMWEPPADSDG